MLQNILQYFWLCTLVLISVHVSRADHFSLLSIRTAVTTQS